MNRRPGACRYKYCGGEKDGNYKISWEHVGLSTRIASSYLPFGELGDKRSSELGAAHKRAEVEIKIERRSHSLYLSVTRYLNLLRAGGRFNSLLAKPRKPPAGVVYISIDFSIAESNELPPFRP